MLMIFAKIIITVAMVLGLTWLGKSKPGLAGFLVVLPTISLLIILFSHAEMGDAFDVRGFARGMYRSLPVLAAFYAPFLILNNFYLSLAIGFVFIFLFAAVYRYFGVV